MKFINKKLPKQIWYNEINIILLHSKIKKMKNLIIYITLIFVTIFSVYSSLTMDVPTDVQIIMLLFGNVLFSLFIMVLVQDVRQYNKEMRLKPQRF